MTSSESKRATARLKRVMPGSAPAVNARNDPSRPTMSNAALSDDSRGATSNSRV